jgi:Flp pilus assembly protein TadG
MRATRKWVIRGRGRRGAAAVEFALLLPFLTVFLLGTIDFARLFYHYITISNCARNGALWASDPYANPALGTVTSATTQSPYADVTAAALADSNLSPTPTVSAIASGTDSAGNVTKGVTVNYTFTPFSKYLGMSSVAISREVWMRVLPTTAN